MAKKVVNPASKLSFGSGESLSVLLFLSAVVAMVGIWKHFVITWLRFFVLLSFAAFIPTN